MNFDKEEPIEEQLYQEKLKLRFQSLFKNSDEIESDTIALLREFIHPILSSLSEESFFFLFLLEALK